MCIKLEINQGYTTMHGQPIIKIKKLLFHPGQPLETYRQDCARVVSVVIIWTALIVKPIKDGGRLSNLGPKM
jgi:hypothetical protein